MTRIDDTDLFMAFQRGEADADKSIFELYFRSLCFFAEKLTFHSIVETEDIVADSFMKMYQKRADFANLANVRSFLYLVTRNACINKYKAVLRQKQANKSIVDMESNSLWEDTLDYELTRVKVLQEIYEEVEALPGRCKEIFKLIFFDGFSTEQIADLLNISPQTVRTQKARALQLLRTQLIQKGKFSLLIFMFAWVANNN